MQWCFPLLSYGLWWVIIHYTWFPPMLNTNQDFLKYGFMIHEILFDSFSLNGLQWPGRYSESDFQHQTGTSSCRCPLKGGHQHPLGTGAKRGGSLCHIIHSWWNFAISGYCLSSPKDALLVYFPPLIFGNNYRETMAREVCNRTSHNVRLNNWILTNTFQAASLWSLCSDSCHQLTGFKIPQIVCARAMMTWWHE